MSRRKRLTALAACLALSLAFSIAQAAPTIIIRTDREDAMYKKGETATFIIELTDEGKPVPKAELTCELSTSIFENPANTEKQIVTLTDGKAEVKGSRNEPCILWLRATYQPPDGKPIKEVAGAGFDPLEIKPSMPAPDDFDQFWADQKKRVDAIPANPQLTPVQSDDPNVEIYSITLDNINGTKVYGYIAKPKGDGRFPAMLMLQWSGVYSLDPNRAKWPAQSGFIALNINAHAIPNGEPKAYYDELSGGALKDYAHIGRDSRDTCYFLRMYLSCYRAAEYLASRPDWDKKHLLVDGTSQGGALTLVTAALSPHVTAASATVPALCDQTAILVGRSPGWPWLVGSRDGKPDPVQLQVARYFDVVNLCREIHVPVLIGTGFKDTTCPSSNVYAAYNVIPGPKQMVVDPLAGHSANRPKYTPAYQEFLREQG